MNSKYNDGITTENYTHPATFDSLNRLTSYTGYSYQAAADPFTWKLKYYK